MYYQVPNWRPRWSSSTTTHLPTTWSCSARSNPPLTSTPCSRRNEHASTSEPAPPTGTRPSWSRGCWDVPERVTINMCDIMTSQMRGRKTCMTLWPLKCVNDKCVWRYDLWNAWTINVRDVMTSEMRGRFTVNVFTQGDCYTHIKRELCRMTCSYGCQLKTTNIQELWCAVKMISTNSFLLDSFCF